jgi:hypothetical protein
LCGEALEDTSSCLLEERELPLPIGRGGERVVCAVLVVIQREGKGVCLLV